MDVDLSTDLDALLPLVAPLVSGHSDVAIGTRLAPGARVVRGPKREAISRIYNLILKDDAAQRVLRRAVRLQGDARPTSPARCCPLVEDQGWFFDTELLVLAEHNGLRIHEVPVDWVDDPDSRVDVVGTAKADLQGHLADGAPALARAPERPVDPAHAATRAIRRVDVGPGDLGSQLVRFASIGVVSTIVFGLLFALLVGPLGFVARRRRRPRRVRGRQHRRQPSPHLRPARSGRAGAALPSALALALLPLALTLLTLLGLSIAGVTSLPATLVATHRS